jgi:hypothetical protein
MIYACKATRSWAVLEAIRISPGAEGLNALFAQAHERSHSLSVNYYRFEFREAYVSLKERRLFKAPAGENNNWQGDDH